MNEFRPTPRLEFFILQYENVVRGQRQHVVHELRLERNFANLKRMRTLGENRSGKRVKCERKQPKWRFCLWYRACTVPAKWYLAKIWYGV